MKHQGLRRLVSLALSVAVASPAGAAKARAADEAGVVHALNRLTWGPRPGDVEQVTAMGLERWLDQQLHPERIRDTKAEARVASLKTAGLTTAELRKGYEVPLQARREFKEMQAAMGDNPSEEQVREAKRELAVKLVPRMEGRPQQVIDELQEAKILRAIYTERQLDDVLADFWMNHFNVYAAKGPDRFLLAQYERETIRPRAWGKFEDLLRATAESPAMLFYLDNWLSTAQNTSLADLASSRRGGMTSRLGGALGLRPGRRLGSFGSRGASDGMRRPDDDLKGLLGKGGLNENYAREIMELHSLGVDGGYTQKDVTEVARCFSGWTLQGLRDNDAAPRFVFVQALHDRGDKLVLGQKIKGGGKEEADKVIRLLATHPSTARFISWKLARRLVADEPKAALVERAAATFTRTGGEIRAVVTTLVTSPEFVAPEVMSAKLKTPLEFVVSAARATGADVLDARELAKRIDEMGMPLYMQQPPTGYKDTADAWVSASGLLARLNFVLDLDAGRIPGTLVETSRVDPELLGSPQFQRK